MPLLIYPNIKTESLNYKSGCGTCTSSEHLEAKYKVMQRCMYRRNTEKIQVLKKELRLLQLPMHQGYTIVNTMLLLAHLKQFTKIAKD